MFLKDVDDLTALKSVSSLKDRKDVKSRRSENFADLDYLGNLKPKLASLKKI